METPLKHAVSIILKNKEGKVLFALRSPHKTSYPNVWSLPSHYVKEGETFEDTVRRIGMHKLGIDLVPINMIHEGTSDREDFTLFMHDYLVESEGEPRITSDDYIELRWEYPEIQFASMKVMGDCCRLYKEFLEKE